MKYTNVNVAGSAVWVYRPGERGGVIVKRGESVDLTAATLDDERNGHLTRWISEGWLEPVAPPKPKRKRSTRRRTVKKKAEAASETASGVGE